MSLADALEACRRGDAAGALVALLAAWHARRADAIGDAIAAIGPRAAHTVPAPMGETREALAAAWTEAATSGEPCVRHHLIESAREVSELRLLALGDADPRVARAIADEIAKPHRRHSSFTSIDKRITDAWRPATALLVAARDGRALATIAGAATAIVERLSDARRVGGRTRIDQMVAAVRAACTPAPVVGGDEAAMLAEILAWAVAKPANADAERATEDSLLAEIYRDPAADGPRSVYADWLAERGHPRAELITLQLAGGRAAEERAATLLGVHVDEYLGPLAGQVVTAGATFERGFVARCAVSRAELIEHASWATVTAISGGMPATDACPMPVLTLARELAVRDLAKLARLATPPPLEDLDVRGTPADEPALATAYTAVAPRLARLRRVGLHGFAGREGNIAARLAFTLHARPLARLEVTAPLDTAAGWFAELERSAVAMLILHAYPPRPMGYWTWLDSWLLIAREEAGWRIQLQAVSGTKSADIARMIDGVIAPLLARVPVVASFGFNVPASSEWRTATRTRLAAVLDAHPALATRDLAARLRYPE